MDYAECIARCELDYDACIDGLRASCVSGVPEPFSYLSRSDWIYRVGPEQCRLEEQACRARCGRPRGDPPPAPVPIPVPVPTPAEEGFFESAWHALGKIVDGIEDAVETAYDTAVEFVKDHPYVTAGALIVVAGVVFVAVGGPAGVVALVQLAPEASAAVISALGAGASAAPQLVTP